MNGRNRLVLVCGAVALVQSGPARTEREVVVNGQNLSAAQIAELERLACAPIPDGRYWLGQRSGLWGHVGDPRPRGRIAGHCRDRREPLRSNTGSIYRGSGTIWNETTDSEKRRELPREESEIGTTSQPHAPGLRDAP